MINQIAGLLFTLLVILGLTSAFAGVARKPLGRRFYRFAGLMTFLFLLNLINRAAMSPTYSLGAADFFVLALWVGLIFLMPLAHWIDRSINDLLGNRAARRARGNRAPTWHPEAGE